MNSETELEHAISALLTIKHQMSSVSPSPSSRRVLRDVANTLLSLAARVPAKPNSPAVQLTVTPPPVPQTTIPTPTPPRKPARVQPGQTHTRSPVPSPEKRRIPPASLRTVSPPVSSGRRPSSAPPTQKPPPVFSPRAAPASFVRSPTKRKREAETMRRLEAIYGSTRPASKVKPQFRRPTSSDHPRIPNVSMNNAVHPASVPPGRVLVSPTAAAATAASLRFAKASIPSLPLASAVLAAALPAPAPAPVASPKLEHTPSPPSAKRADDFHGQNQEDEEEIDFIPLEESEDVRLVQLSGEFPPPLPASQPLHGAVTASQLISSVSMVASEDAAYVAFLSAARPQEVASAEDEVENREPSLTNVVATAAAAAVQSPSPSPKAAAPAAPRPLTKTVLAKIMAELDVSESDSVHSSVDSLAVHDAAAAATAAAGDFKAEVVADLVVEICRRKFPSVGYFACAEVRDQLPRRLKDAGPVANKRRCLTWAELVAEVQHRWDANAVPATVDAGLMDKKKLAQLLDAEIDRITDELTFERQRVHRTQEDDIAAAVQVQLVDEIADLVLDDTLGRSG